MIVYKLLLVSLIKEPFSRLLLMYAALISTFILGENNYICQGGN